MSSGSVNERLWRAAEVIQEIAASWPRAKDYVLPILFVRFLSAWHEETLTAYRRKYNGDAVRVSRAMSRERFAVPSTCSFEHLLFESTFADAGDRVNLMLRTIEHANDRKLEGVFASSDFNSPELGNTSERNVRIRNLLGTVANIDSGTKSLRTTMWIGALAELLISHFAEDTARQREPYYTPPEIAELVVRLVNPDEGERIYDPACGSGALLTHAGRSIIGENFALLGHEAHHKTWALCRISLIFQGMDSARITHGDPIRAPILKDDDTLQKFEVIVSDPPFSFSEWDVESLKFDRFSRFSRGVPSKSSGDYALITHIVQTMDPFVGRACLVVPLGTLFRGGVEGLIRRRLIEEGKIEGVVRLPSNLFLGTAIPAALLLFRAKRSENSIFFIDASRDFASGKNRNLLREQDIERITSTWEHRTEVAGYSRMATLDDMEKNEFNLNVALYVKSANEEKVNLESVASEIERLGEQLSKARLDLVSALGKLPK